LNELNPADVLKYQNHLIKAFSYITNNPTIKRCCNDISILSGKIRDSLNTMKKSNKWFVSISPPWKIPIQDDGKCFQTNQAFLSLSGILSVENSEFQLHSFVSSIVLEGVKATSAVTQIPISDYCEYKHVYKDRLIRRFHFDLATGKDKNKPLSHLQFGGKLYYSKYAYPLNPKIGLPRIPYPPIDFIILFDMMVRQFNTKITSNFYDNKDWVNIVKTSESFRLESYYSEIQKYFRGNFRHKPLTAAFIENERFKC
jgi:hypothetical protein